MMELILWVLAIAISGLALSAAIFAALTIDERRAHSGGLDEQLARRAPQGFFVAAASEPRAPRDVPVDLLLLQLEQHIRLEQAAAESFHLSPTPESLHVRTTSPLVIH